LLRVLEERAVTPVGAWSPVPVDFRLIGSTHRPLPALARNGEFRQDLFARMEGAVIELPALRERREDVPQLFRALSEQAMGRAVPPLSARFVERLCLHSWPRNVRELRLTAERLATFHGAEPKWRCRHLVQLGLGERHSGPPLIVESAPPSPAPPAVAARSGLEGALVESHGNVAAAARRLGVSKMTVYRWLSEGGLSPARFRSPRSPRG
jgi:transcriptional regulator of acetoin/glycerol metabolism